MTLWTPVRVKKIFAVDNLLLDYVGLPHVLVLVVHLVHFRGWVGRRNHSRGSWPYVDLLFWSHKDQIPALSYIHHTVADQVQVVINTKTNYWEISL